jgi:hypothetical protein
VSTKLTYPEELKHWSEGATSVAEAATRRGDHMHAAVTLARAGGYQRALALYFNGRKGSEDRAAKAQHEARRLGDQADMAADAARGDPNVAVMPRGDYMRHHAFEPTPRAEWLCKECVYRETEPIHTVHEVAA